MQCPVWPGFVWIFCSKEGRWGLSSGWCRSGFPLSMNWVYPRYWRSWCWSQEDWYWSPAPPAAASQLRWLLWLIILIRMQHAVWLLLRTLLNFYTMTKNVSSSSGTWETIRRVLQLPLRTRCVTIPMLLSSVKCGTWIPSVPQSGQQRPGILC